MSERGPVPELDISHAHSARVYNYWLGGKDNYAADRDAAEQAIAANPGIVADVRANRAFLARVVRFLAGECGIGQFLDLGTGLPTAGNAHEVAQAVNPAARVVYVDNDRTSPGCAHAHVTVCDCLKCPLLARLRALGHVRELSGQLRQSRTVT
ncbi:MAG TPA: SAM-dependent methyltransferase, partial [Streptosporangiaceae bacterium]